MGHCSSKAAVQGSVVEQVPREAPQPAAAAPPTAAGPATLPSIVTVVTNPAAAAAQVVAEHAAHTLATEVEEFLGNLGKLTLKVPEVGYETRMRTVYGMGWKPDLPDHRDRFMNVKAHSKVKGGVPALVDLRDAERFPVYDQGHLGSCTANAIAACYHYAQLKEGLKNDFSPSRLYIYYNERAKEGTIAQDSGAMLRDGMKTVHKLGVCSEAEWPYDIAKFTEKPTPACYSTGAANKAKEYARVEQDLESLKGCLAAGFPFVFGFAVYESFTTKEVAKTGQMCFPPTGKPLGGHAVHACGYDDAKKVFIVRNSWSDKWGDKGHFYMPYEYILHPQLARDFWAINFVSDWEFPTQKAAVAK